MNLRAIIAEVLAEFARPETGATWQRWLGLATGHVVLGLFLTTWAMAFSGGAEWAPVTVLAIYTLKEVGDLIRDGKPFDSLVDLTFVAAGVAMVETPLMASIVAAVLMAVGVINVVSRR